MYDVRLDGCGANGSIMTRAARLVARLWVNGVGQLDVVRWARSSYTYDLAHMHMPIALIVGFV